MVCVIFTISSHGRQYYVISKDFWKYVNIDLKHKGACLNADMTKKSFSFARWIMTNSSNELGEKWRQEVLTRKNTTISLKSTTYASSSSSSLSCKPEKEMHKKEILKLNFAFALLSSCACWITTNTPSMAMMNFRKQVFAPLCLSIRRSWSSEEKNRTKFNYKGLRNFQFICGGKNEDNNRISRHLCDFLPLWTIIRQRKLVF